MNDRLSLRVDYETRILLNQLAARKNLNLSATLRELIHREFDTVQRPVQPEGPKELFISGIDIHQLIYHICRASIAPVAAVQIADREIGDRLNEQVKSAAEKLVTKLTNVGS